MLYCKNCGKPLSGSKPFCRYCGARTSAPILGGKPPAPMNYEDTVPLDSTQFIKYSEQNKKKTGSMNTRVIIAVLCAAAAVMAAAIMAVILTNKPSLPVNGEDGENISAYTDRIHTPMQTDDIKAPAVFTVEPTMQPVPPTRSRLRQDMCRRICPALPMYGRRIIWKILFCRAIIENMISANFTALALPAA